jgi:hypothetical protein
LFGSTFAVAFKSVPVATVVLEDADTEFPDTAADSDDVPETAALLEAPSDAPDEDDEDDPPQAASDAAIIVAKTAAAICLPFFIVFLLTICQQLPLPVYQLIVFCALLHIYFITYFFILNKRFIPVKTPIMTPDFCAIIY